MPLQIGDPAPPFSGLDHRGQPLSWQDFAGSGLILYFYPKDNTPGCTTEAVTFSKLAPDFAALGVKILGVSPDSPQSHDKFITKYQLTIPLLSDPDHTIAEAYGAWGLKKFMGKEYWGILRSTFLIDAQGKIIYCWPKVKVKGHGEDVWTQVHRLMG
ncbi:thioredoxin-dependent thiol peroxidase [Synechocystis sp. LKSZ1]|uniref:thioredoxin-dependent thiol peroxidase n=1 Tax=Synechocystis sp. LKSZ1 TaxID=3144951 RepID=UPI00336C28E6